MDITIEPVTSNEDAAAMSRIRRLVFEREMGVDLPPLEVSATPGALHLLARVRGEREPVGALSVIETSGDHRLHESCGLKFDSDVRVARYTQLAVMKPYRGMSIPLMMVLEAHRLFVVPGQFDYTWLLFDLERARSSFVCKWLAFNANSGSVQSEYGRSCALMRDEHAPLSEQALLQARWFIEELQREFAPSSNRVVYQAGSA